MRKRWNGAWPTSVMSRAETLFCCIDLRAQMDKIEEAVISLLPQIDLLVVWEKRDSRRRN